MSFLFLSGFRGRIDTGVEHFITGIGSLMTILAPGRSPLLSMASHAQAVVSALQAGLILVITLNVTLQESEIIGTKTICRMAVTAGDL